MRRIVVGGVVVMTLGLSAFFTIPMAMVFWAEYRIQQDCDLASPSSGCVARMRAMGNIWSSRNDNARAEPWYQLAANQADPIAMFDLGWLHKVAALQELAQSSKKTPAFEDEIRKSFLWTSKAAEQGFVPAMNNLGEMYWNGLQPKLDSQVLSEPNYREAFKWHMAAAQAHNPVAVWNVAHAYAVGQAFDPNPAGAIRWAAWKPEGFNEADLKVPVLERTGFSGRSLTSNELFSIRQSVTENVPASVGFTPMKPDSRLPVFHTTLAPLCPDPNCKK